MADGIPLGDARDDVHLGDGLVARPPPAKVAERSKIAELSKVAELSKLTSFQKLPSCQKLTSCQRRRQKLNSGEAST